MSLNKSYWQEVSYAKQNPSIYRLRCPKCGRIFVMPKKWGVWKGCPICWIRLNYKKVERTTNG